MENAADAAAAALKPRGLTTRTEHRYGAALVCSLVHLSVARGARRMPSAPDEAGSAQRRRASYRCAMGKGTIRSLIWGRSHRARGATGMAETWEKYAMHALTPDRRAMECPSKLDKTPTRNVDRSSLKPRARAADQNSRVTPDYPGSAVLRTRSREVSREGAGEDSREAGEQNSGETNSEEKSRLKW
jgi:hypothetical protein